MPRKKLEIILPPVRRKRFKFKVGDEVRKVTGYKFHGVVKSVYRTDEGEPRYVVQATHKMFAGWQMIFNGDQLGD